MLTLIQTHKVPPVPIVLLDRAFWERVVDIDFLVDEGMLAPTDRDLCQFCETASDAWRYICSWHERHGTLGFPPPEAVP
jgi:predicted Rossmann-fold nucleotide-binding protein